MRVGRLTQLCLLRARKRLRIQCALLDDLVHDVIELLLLRAVRGVRK